MTAFDTPGPISATIDLPLGDVHISAGDGVTTTVEVRPSDPSNENDVKVAEGTRVECSDRKLLVRAPKLASWAARKRGGSIAVTIELPAGSDVNGSGGLTDFFSDGRLGDCRIKTGLGRIQLDQAANVALKTGLGDVTLDHATGCADVKAGSGAVRLRELDGSAVVKNANGDTWIGLAGGDLRLRSANGNIAVDRARAGVGARSARGDVRVGEVARGAVVLETAAGDLEVGIPEGTAAWLDVSSAFGRVHNELAVADAPEATAERVEVRARTTVGDVVIRRPA